MKCFAILLTAVAFAFCLLSCLGGSDLPGHETGGYGRFEGTVIDSATTEPILGASVRFGPSCDGTMTEVDGCFRSRRLKPDVYELQVSAVGYLSARISDQYLLADSTVRLTMELAPDRSAKTKFPVSTDVQDIVSLPHSIIEGVVMDVSSDRPIVNALIEFEETCRRTSTDARGRFTVDHMGQGKYTAVISAQHFFSAGKTLRTKYGYTTELTVLLRQRPDSLDKHIDTTSGIRAWSEQVVRTDSSEVGCIEGFVFDKRSKLPIVGASVWLMGTRTGDITGSDGSYQVRRIIPGIYSVRFTAIDYKLLEVRGIQVEAGSTSACSVSLDIDRYLIVDRIYPSRR